MNSPASQLVRDGLFRNIAPGIAEREAGRLSESCGIVQQWSENSGDLRHRRSCIWIADYINKGASSHAVADAGIIADRAVGDAERSAGFDK